MHGMMQVSGKQWKTTFPTLKMLYLSCINTCHQHQTQKLQQLSSQGMLLFVVLNLMLVWHWVHLPEKCTQTSWNLSMPGIKLAPQTFNLCYVAPDFPKYASYSCKYNQLNGWMFFRAAVVYTWWRSDISALCSIPSKACIWAILTVFIIIKGIF